MCGVVVSLKPGYEDLRHFHQVDRTRRSVHEAFNCVDDHSCIERSRILGSLQNTLLAQQVEVQFKRYLPVHVQVYKQGSLLSSQRP